MSSQTGRSDSELVKLAKEEDYIAFEELVNRHSGRIYSLLQRLLGNREDAEDLLQQTFLSAFQNLSRFREESSFRTWITRIATNFALMKFRKEGKAQVVSLDGPQNYSDEGIPLPREIADWSVNPAEVLERKELVEILEAAIAKLPQIYRAVFLLRDLEGLSNQEVAGMMDLSVSAVKSRLMRARLFLRATISSMLKEEKGAL
ncbi:MAG: sigma-70 family RNA polymerase sigma factor [candidate division NC10 bacterium]|nr:sigma-70 family RNA polymerase sigma factor [candidate division NC10 bacterium]